MNKSHETYKKKVQRNPNSLEDLICQDFKLKSQYTNEQIIDKAIWFIENGNKENGIALLKTLIE